MFHMVGGLPVLHSKPQEQQGRPPAALGQRGRRSGLVGVVSPLLLAASPMERVRHLLRPGGDGHCHSGVCVPVESVQDDRVRGCQGERAGEHAARHIRFCVVAESEPIYL